jgi:hypothetical protein
MTRVAAGFQTKQAGKKTLHPFQEKNEILLGS